MTDLPGLKFHTWLKNQIDSKRFKGLEYVLDNEKVFRIPWNKKHTEPDEERLFEAYAAYRNSNGSNGSPKTKFRNTLSKCPYIGVEFSDIENQEKNFKLLKFLEPHEVEQRKKNMRKNGKVSPQSSPELRNFFLQKRWEPCPSVGAEEQAEVDALSETFPQLDLTDQEIEVLIRGGAVDCGTVELEEMEYSYVREIFQPLTKLHQCIQDYGIPLKDLSKFALSISYKGTIVHTELVDFTMQPVWILHGLSIDQYSQLIMEKRLVLINDLRPIQLPQTDDNDVKEILDISNLGFSIGFDYQSLKLKVQRFSQARVFENNCGVEKKIDRYVLHYGFGYESLYEGKHSLSERLKFEFSVGHSIKDTMFPYITVRLQSALTEKFEQIAAPRQGKFLTNELPNLFPSEETSVERSVERIKREQGN